MKVNDKASAESSCKVPHLVKNHNSFHAETPTPDIGIGTDRGVHHTPLCKDASHVCLLSCRPFALWGSGLSLIEMLGSLSIN